MESAVTEKFEVGDTVYCLAWLGKAFQVVEFDDNTGRMSLEAPTASDPRGAQVDLFPDMMWMATHEPWDQIWYWPDRAGEHYNEIVDRYISENAAGTIVRGYHFGPDDYGIYLTPAPASSMAFRVLGAMLNMIRVEPVVPVDSDGRVIVGAESDDGVHEWVSAGAAVPLRLSMVGYRWCLSFGEFIMNWNDLMQRLPGHEGFASIRHPDGTFSRPRP